MSLATRVIARLDVKASLGVVKGRQMEGLRVVGDPHTLALKYAADGADEILYLDVTASLFGQPAIHALVERTSRDVYVPLTVGGGIRNLGDVRRLLRAGADKVAINTAALARPEFITEIAETFGSQACVVSVEVKRRMVENVILFDAMTSAGRDVARRGGAFGWCHEAAQRGAGELLVTSVDFDGTMQGLDTIFLGLLNVNIPVVASGGCGSPTDVLDALAAGADAVALGATLHHNTWTIPEIKAALAAAGHEVRV